MSELADLTREVTHAAGKAAADPSRVRESRYGDQSHTALVPLVETDEIALAALSQAAVEPNAYHLPEWLQAISASARNRTDIDALCAWESASATSRLVAVMPVVSLWRAYGIPLPALVSAQPYGTLGTPHLDREDAVSAAEGLIDAARRTGARALLFRDLALAGPAATAIRHALVRQGLQAIEIESSRRALLDATQDAERLLHDALGTKKLKELRRQRRRLADIGPVHFRVASTPQDVRSALDTFLVLEASGWKGKRGTALTNHEGDALFVRRATAALAKRGQCEIATLHAGDTPLAAAIVLRHQDRAFTFKIGYDEAFAKFSPGVQLVLDLTRHFCSDPAIATVDSTAAQDHPMIGPIWRGRLAVGDILIPLRRHDPLCTAVHFALVARLRLRAAARRALDVIRRT